MDLKKCTRCKKDQPLRDYYSHGPKLSIYCRYCVMEMNRIRRSNFSPEQQKREQQVKAASRKRIRSIPPDRRTRPDVVTCKRCKQTKCIDEFEAKLAVTRGCGTRCRVCVREVRRERYAQLDHHRSIVKRARDKYRSTPQGKLAELDYLFKRKYGITVSDYLHLLDIQNGLCALCLLPPPPTKRLAVDHDHLTRKVRGLLCTKCNNTLERFDSVPQFAERVCLYLNTPPFTQVITQPIILTESEATN